MDNIWILDRDVSAAKELSYQIKNTYKQASCSTLSNLDDAILKIENNQNLPSTLFINSNLAPIDFIKRLQFHNTLQYANVIVLTNEESLNEKLQYAQYATVQSCISLPLEKKTIQYFFEFNNQLSA